MRHLAFLIVLSIPIYLQGQPNLVGDTAFFNQQAKLYQGWLDKTGIGSLLKVGGIEIRRNKIFVGLVAKKDKAQNFRNHWDQWSKDYVKINAISLEQRLFYKLYHMLEVDQEQIELDIYDQSPRFCHRIIVSFHDGKVDAYNQACRAKDREIEVSPTSFYEPNSMTFEAIQKKFNRRAVYNSILDYSRKKYEKSKCELRYPEVTVLEQGEVLRFIVTDLCKEVLIDEGDPWICRVLKRFNHQCNWIKREKLEFLITFQNIPSGIKIGVQIDGKYGSGYYENVKRGGYHLMDNDFDDYLEDYADRMKTEFKSVILEIRD